jgi:hypothetical protein
LAWFFIIYKRKRNVAVSPNLNFPSCKEAKKKILSSKSNILWTFF